MNLALFSFDDYVVHTTLASERDEGEDLDKNGGTASLNKVPLLYPLLEQMAVFMVSFKDRLVNLAICDHYTCIGWLKTIAIGGLK